VNTLSEASQMPLSGLKSYLFRYANFIAL